MINFEVLFYYSKSGEMTARNPWIYRCEMEDILLEMDRILRPSGGVIIRDDVDVLLKVKSITEAMQWEGRIADHEKGPHQREKILFAVKQYWTAPAPDQSHLQQTVTAS